MSTSWDQTIPKPGATNGEMQTRLGTARTLINAIQHLDWVVDGVSFMKAAIAHLEQRRKETAIQGGRFTNDQGKHTYVKFVGKGTICSSITRMSVIVTTTRQPSAFTPS